MHSCIMMVLYSLVVIDQITISFKMNIFFDYTILLYLPLGSLPTTFFYINNRTTKFLYKTYQQETKSVWVTENELPKLKSLALLFLTLLWLPTERRILGPKVSGTLSHLFLKKIVTILLQHIINNFTLYHQLVFLAQES